MHIKPIRTEAAYRRALHEIERLWDARPGSPACDKLDVLATLAEAYERQHHAIAPPDPIEAIRFRMEQMQLTRKDLEPYLGGRARVAEILNRRRRLSLTMIRKIHRGLGIPAEVLIQEPIRAAGQPRSASSL